jgi:hypothetical protein
VIAAAPAEAITSLEAVGCRLGADVLCTSSALVSPIVMMAAIGNPSPVKILPSVI